MNKIYYTGYLYKLLEENECSSSSFEEEMRKICNQDEDLSIGNILKNSWLYGINDVLYPTLIDKLNQVVKNVTYMTGVVGQVQGKKLIFEIIKDENNVEYAREIFSNRIFPLIKNNDIEAKYYMENIKANNVGSNIYERRTDFIYNLSIKFSCKKENILKLDNFFYLPASKAASPYEINYYLERECKTPRFLFGKPKTNHDFLKKINNLSNKNAFQSEIIEKQAEKVEREKLDKVVKIMEQIRYSLLILDEVNHEIKEEKEKKFNELIDNYDKGLTTSPLNLNTLSKLETEIKFAIKIGEKNESTILDTLDNMIIEYSFSNITNRTISDIDETVKLFLQMNYSPIIQSNAIEKFAMIYIYELCENKESIDINELENSYINDMLPTVLMCLRKMINNNEIENNIIIKLEENPTLSYVIDCIKKIEFVKNKELIKEK